MQRQDDAIRRLVASQAAEWHVACSEGELAPQQARALMSWLRASPLHVAEFLRVASIAAEVADIARADPTSVDALDTDEPDALPFGPAGYAFVARDARRAAKRLGHRARGFDRVVVRGVAAMLAVAILASGAWFGWRHSAPGPSMRTYATAHGQQSSFVLPDHTAVELDSDSAITIQFNASERRVVVDRGQVYFKVARDPERPFSVRVEQSLVRDIGTAFDIYRHPAGSSITVAEGRVQVWAVAQSQSPTTEWSHWFGRRTKQADTLVASLGAGRQVQLTASGQVVSLGDADVQRALAWRHGQIAFDNESIGSVVAQFNRYNQVQIRVADGHLARLPITGVFDARDVAAFTTFLGSLPDVKVSRHAQTVTVLAEKRLHRHRQ